MKVGYVRASTEEQNTARQEVIMQELGVEKVFIEKVSGKTQRGREQLEREYILDRQREGIEIARQNGKYQGRKPVTIDLLSAGERLCESRSFGLPLMCDIIG